MSAQKNQNWGYYEAKWLVEICADEEIQRELSAMGRKQNIWEKIAANLNDNGCKRTASSAKIKFTIMHETCLKPTSDVNKAITNYV